MFGPKFWIAVAPTIGLAVDVLTHFAATWLLPIRNLYHRLLFGALWGAAATTVVTGWGTDLWSNPSGPGAAYLLFNLATLAILSFGYFNFVQMNLSSLRLRIANELFDNPQGVPPATLLDRYGAREIVDQRLARLARGNQIVRRGDRYFHRPSTVYWIAVAMDLTKRTVLRRSIRDSFRRQGRS